MVQGVIDFKIIAIVELLSGEVITFTLPFSILWGAGGGSYGTSEAAAYRTREHFVCDGS